VINNISTQSFMINDSWQNITTEGTVQFPLVCGTMSGDDRWFYVPQGFAAYLNIRLSDATSTSLGIQYSAYNGAEVGSVTFTQVDTTASIWHTVPIPGSGWYRIIHISSGAVNIMINEIDFIVSSGSVAAVGTASGLLPLAPPAELSNSVTPYLSSRCNAAAVLLSNVTSVMNKEGTVIAVRHAVGSRPFWSEGWETGAMTSDIYAVSPQDKYFGLLEKGLYAYTMGDKATAEFADCYDENLNVPLFNLRGFNYVSLITLYDMDSTSVTNLAVTVDYTLEFRTTSMLFPNGYSTSTLEEYHRAQMAMVRCGMFFENPIHLSAIAGLISKAARLIAPYVTVKYGSEHSWDCCSSNSEGSKSR